MAELRRSSYQLVALTKLLSNGHNAVLICDGVGVGKTISAAFALCYLSYAFQKAALVICPPSLVDKWYLELRTKFRLDAVPIRSREELNLTIDYWNSPGSSKRTFILPSSLLRSLRGVQFSGPVVIDEIHNYRNFDTSTWAAAKALTATASHRIGLSATPINNGLADLAAEFAILLGLDIHVTQALVEDTWRPERQQVLYPLMTRFTKERLQIHFAKREVHDVQIPITEGYREKVVSAVKSLRGRSSDEKIYRDEITYFRLAASSSGAFARSTGISISGFEKIDYLLKILERHSSEPVIVFCEFEETARELEAALGTRLKFIITGSVPVFLREGILDRFRDTENAVLIMTSVGAEGIDLQFCSTLVNFDLNWNPMVLEQRIGRIDRIGQRKSTITIYNLVVKGSIDERIIEVLGRKLGLVEGSVLEPATVLGSATYTQPLLFDDTDFQEELRKAQTLANAVELSSSIIPEDYDLLPAIDSDYCEPEMMRHAASLSALAWLRPSAASEKWQQEMRFLKEKLSSLIDFYNA